MPYEKKPIAGKVDKLGKGSFKIKKDKTTEDDIDINITDVGENDFEAEKLSLDNLPSKLDPDDPNSPSITWVNNFVIKFKNGGPINQSYTAKIPGSSAWKSQGKSLVLFDGNTHGGKPWLYPSTIVDDTIELTDGDPAVGRSP
jgi:hypothetical protein